MLGEHAFERARSMAAPGEIDIRSLRKAGDLGRVIADEYGIAAGTQHVGIVTAVARGKDPFQGYRKGLRDMPHGRGLACIARQDVEQASMAEHHPSRNPCSLQSLVDRTGQFR